MTHEQETALGIILVILLIAWIMPDKSGISKIQRIISAALKQTPPKTSAAPPPTDAAGNQLVTVANSPLQGSWPTTPSVNDPNAGLSQIDQFLLGDGSFGPPQSAPGGTPS